MLKKVAPFQAAPVSWVPLFLHLNNKMTVFQTLILLLHISKDMYVFTIMYSSCTVFYSMHVNFKVLVKVCTRTIIQAFS